MEEALDLDPAIRAALPTGCTIVAIDPHGETNWSNGFRVEVEAGDQEERFFLKIIERENALAMAQGEYESQKALSQSIPSNISPALAYGPLELEPEKAFFLTKYHDLHPRIIDPAQLASILKQLHSNSSSPTGKFGFPVTTFKGYITVDNRWTDTWEEWFARQFRDEIAWEQSIRGVHDEFNTVAEEFFEKVIPRLLRPLQTEGRSISPVLVHGDLWHGNIEFDVDSQVPILFDSCCVYGHSEFDLSLMVADRYRLKTLHVNEYIKEMGVSEPQAEFNDRLLLYHLRNELVVSGLWPNWSHLREIVLQDMRKLLAKYPNGLEGAKPIVRFPADEGVAM